MKTGRCNYEVEYPKTLINLEWLIRRQIKNQKLVCKLLFDCGSVSKCPFAVNLISSHVAPCGVDVALLAVNCLFNIPKNPRKRSPQ